MLLYEKKKNALIVRLTGELDHSAASRMRGELDALIADSGARRLIFDLHDLKFMDSSGIGLIIGRYKRLSRRGGSVAVADPDQRIDRLFRMSGVYQVVERLA